MKVMELAGNTLAQGYAFSINTLASRKKVDANGDGVIDVLDVVCIVNIALGRT